MIKTNFHGIISVRLYAFRCYRDIKIELPLQCRLIGIYGSNGSGKTSILDAVSIFSDTKYFAVKYDDLLSWQQDGHQWVLALQLMHSEQTYCIKCCFDRHATPQATYFINNYRVSLEEIQQKFGVIAMYPKLFRNIMDHSSYRRNWLDKCVDMLDDGHYNRCLQYKKLIQQRLKLLQKSLSNNYQTWLTAIETRLSELAVAICAQRMYWAKLIKTRLKDWTNYQLPLIGLELAGEVEEHLHSGRRAIDIEQTIKEQFMLNRDLDRESYSNSLGPSCSKIKFTIDEHPINLSSHGQQQMALLILTFAQADCLYRQCDKLLLILLDDMHAHLDKSTIKKLRHLYQDLPNQIWATSVNIKDLQCVFGQGMQALHIKQSGSDRDIDATLV